MELAAGGRTLAGTMFVPEHPGTGGEQPGLLFLHGFRSDRGGYRERAEAVTREFGLVCLTVDLSGHGESAGDLGQLTPRDHIDEVTAAFDLLAAHPAVDATRIGVCGASFGGFLAAILTGRRPVRKLLLRAPALYRDELLDLPHTTPRHAEPVDSLATRSLQAFEGDALLVESGDDDTIPVEVIKAYLTACPTARHVVLPGAGHALTEPEWRAGFLDEILGFFGRR